MPELEATHSARWVQRQGDRDLEDSRDGSGQLHRNERFKPGVITYEHETKTFSYDCAIRYLADVMGIEEPDVCACFVEAGSELQRVQVPLDEGDGCGRGRDGVRLRAQTHPGGKESPGCRKGLGCSASRLRVPS